MTSMKITDQEGLMSVTSFFELGELENVIDVLALYRCKACGFASPLLDSLSEHITAGCQSGDLQTVEELIEATNIEEPESGLPGESASIRYETLEAVSDEPILENTEASQDNELEVPESPFEDFRCGFCPELFVEYEDLTSHQNEHIQAFQERRHTTAATRSRPRRQRRETKNKPLPCPLCPLEFVSGIDELQQHFSCHVLGRKGFLCAYCDRPAKSWITMLDHLNSSHLLSKTEQRRLKPDDNLRNEVDFEEQVATLSKITALQSSQTESVEGEQSDIVMEESVCKTFTVTTKNVKEKVDLPLNAAQKKRMSKNVYTLGKVKRGRGRPRKYPVTIKEVVVPIDVGTGGPSIVEVSDDDTEHVMIDAADPDAENVMTDAPDPNCLPDNSEAVVAGEVETENSICLPNKTDDMEVDEPSDLNEAMQTDDVSSGGDMGKLFQAVEMAMKQDNVTPEQDVSSVQVVRASDNTNNTENSVPYIKTEQVDLSHSYSKSSPGDPAGEISLKKSPKPVIRTYFLYPKPEGGYTLEHPKYTDLLNQTADEELPKNGCQNSANVVVASCDETVSAADVDDALNKQDNDSGENATDSLNPTGISSFCPHCILIKGSLAEIKLHISSHIQGQEDFQCTICNENNTDVSSFPTYDDVKQHYEVHHKEKVSWFIVPKKSKLGDGLQKRKKPYKCERCTTIYLRCPEEVELHEKCHVEGKERLFRCPTCNKETTAWHAMVSHMMDHNDGKSFKWQNLPVYSCHICGVAKKTKTQLNMHISRGHFREPRKCDSCDKKFTNWTTWRRHTDMEHGTLESFKCDQCPYIGNHSIALRNHMKFHNGTSFQCSECNYSTWNSYTLKSHKKLVHHFNGERVVCDLCGKSLKTRACLIVHMRRKHQRQDEVKCMHCDFVTTNDTYLKAHVLKKHAPKPYQCQLCPYGTMTESVLQSHMRMHADNRPYPCPYTVCFFRARDQKTLASHIKNSHTSDGAGRRFPCSLCGRKFKTITMLKHHMPMHTGEKPHKCSLCGFRGKHRSTVHRHIKSAHCDFYKKSHPASQVRVQTQNTTESTLYIEVPQEKGFGTNYIQVTNPLILDQVTSQQVASIVAFENIESGQVEVSMEQVQQGLALQSSVVPTVVQEVADSDVANAETVMFVPADQIEEVIVESQVASSDVELLKHLMELATTNP